MNKFKLAYSILFAKNKPKDPVAVEKAQESVRVQALKRQVETLNEINEAYAEQVKIMSKELSKQKEGDMQDKLLEMALNLFGGNPTSNTTRIVPQESKIISNVSDSQTQLNLESGVRYSDDQLIGIMETLPPAILQHAKTLSLNQLSDFVKSKFPNISDESIKRSKEILEVMEL